MIEWDMEAYRRKFLETITVFQKTDGKLISGYVVDISQNGADETVFKLNGSGWQSPDIEPVYYRFGGRFYHAGNAIYAVRRRLKKSFKIGMHNDGFIITRVNGESNDNYVKLNPLVAPQINVEQALKKEGLISNNLYISPHTVMLLDRPVGMRKGANFIVDESICQEVKDCLQGFQCSISV